MTHELYGINPRSKDGQYLAINVWGWRPAWHILCNYTPELDEHTRFAGHMNDGYVIKDAQHAAIKRTLTELLRERPRRVEFEGKTKDFGTMPDGRPIANLIPLPGSYFFSWAVLEAILKFCEANDGFSIE